MSDRVAVDAGVKAEIAKDLASPYSRTKVSPAEPVSTAGRWTAFRATL